MRSSILLLVLAAAFFGGCTSAYKTGQTPDDVYYSPARQHDEYLTIKENDDRQYQGNDEYYDDYYLRMKVHNRVMWSELDDWYYYSPRFSYSYYNSWNWNNPWSPYTYWNYYYNPYCPPIFISSGPSTAYYHPRIFNLNTYNSAQLTNNNYTTPKGIIYNTYNSNSRRPVRMVGVNNSNNRNSNSNAGNFLRNIFNSSSNNNNNNSSSSSPSRNSNTSTGSGSSGSSSGSSAPVRKF